MSFEEEWVLPQPVENYTTDDLLARLHAMLPEGLAVSVSGEANNRTLTVRFDVTQVDSIAQALSKRAGQLDWDWHEEMDPPRFGDASYDLHIDIVNDERPILRIYSNDGENRQAWPLVFSIASSLAEDLGALPDEPSN